MWINLSAVLPGKWQNQESVNTNYILWKVIIKQYQKSHSLLITSATFSKKNLHCTKATGLRQPPSPRFEPRLANWKMVAHSLVGPWSYFWHGSKDLGLELKRCMGSAIFLLIYLTGKILREDAITCGNRCWRVIK